VQFVLAERIHKGRAAFPAPTYKKRELCFWERLSKSAQNALSVMPMTVSSLSEASGQETE
jgi:hypothetical protein